MATRARIGFETASGVIFSVYHHFDGYIDGLGKELVTNYNDVNKAYSLVRENIGGYCTILNGDTTPTYTWLDGRLESRDRNDYKDKGNRWSEEYLYLWDSSKARWTYLKFGAGRNFKRVEVALRKVQTEDNG